MERFQSHGGQRRFTEALFPPLPWMGLGNAQSPPSSGSGNVTVRCRMVERRGRAPGDVRAWTRRGRQPTGFDANPPVGGRRAGASTRCIAVALRWRFVLAAHRSRLGESCLALTLGAAGGCQVGITYNVTVQLSGVDGDLQPSSMSSIVLESRLITEEVAVEEHLLDFDLPPLPLGQYQLTTVVLDTRRLPSDPVALLSK